MAKSLPKLLVIVGPTASGKTGLAIRVAKKHHGEIVSADSRLLYKGMDIGTAKPTKKEMAGVRHHLIDVVAPNRTLTLAEYKHLALRAIDGIIRRGKTPILVGGTGLYVWAIVDNLSIPEVPPDWAFRQKSQKLTFGRIWDLLERRDPAYAARVGRNPRYVIRALEVMRATGKTMTELQRKGEPLFDALQIGLKPSDKTLEDRISKRVKQMVKAGLVKEVKKLRKKYSEKAPAMSGIGYRELFPFLRGEISLAEALEAIRLHTRQYARRQMTWFKRDARIRWFSTPEKALKLANKWLSKV